jgi:hypothetical protein
MKKMIFINIILSIILLSCSTSERNISQINTYYAIRSDLKIQIDGMLNEPVWQNAQKVNLKDSDTGEDVTDSTFSTSVFTCYDDLNLYIAFVSNDKDIYSSFTMRDQHLWEEEAVEVFIDVDDDPNSYLEVELSPVNILFDSYIVDPFDIDIEETKKFNSQGIETSVFMHGTVNKRDDIDKKWTCEIAIPFTDFVPNFDPNILKDAKWKINYYRIDRDDDGPVHYAWSPTQGRFHKPSVFGTLIFQ